MQDRLPILHTVPGLAAWAGGPSRTVSALVSHLSHVEDLSVSLLTTARRGEELVLPTSRAVELEVLPQSGGFDAVRMPRLRGSLSAYLATHPHALVHDHGMWLPSNHAVASVCARHASVPRVVSPKGMVDPAALAFGKRKKAIAWALYQHRDYARATAFQATSAAEADNLRRLGFSQPVAVISHGVTCPPIVRTPRRAGSERQALFLSRLHPIKGVADLVHAWRNVRPHGWRLEIVGGGDTAYRRELESLVGASRLEGEIRIRDEVTDNEKWAIYAASDLFVLPSYSENFGVVVAEALGAGLPVITTKGTPWEDIARHDCGWWIDPGAESLASALRAATGRPQSALDEMGQRGSRLISSKYSWDSVASRMAEFYRWLLGRAAKPAFVV
jgi:glycosyltransferase involved in cell wall biosynthesis